MKINPYIGASIICAWVILIIILAVCFPVKASLDRAPKFDPGDAALVVSTGERVTVLQVGFFNGGDYDYECRVTGLRQESRDGLVSADTVLTRHSRVWFRGFELAKR